MPPVIDTASTSYVFRLNFRDVDTENVIKTFQASAASELEIEGILDNIENLTNAGLSAGSVQSVFPITGWQSAIDASQNSVGYIMVLTFTRADPVNESKTLTKSFIIPAPKNALKDATDKKPVSNNADLNALVAWLEDNLQFTDATGTLQTGGWTYNRTASGFGTVSREIDGQ